MPVLRVAPADYYEVLGVGDDATLKQIKTAFKKKAVKTHPDVNKSPNATKDFMLLKEAYEASSWHIPVKHTHPCTKTPSTRQIEYGVSRFAGAYGFFMVCICSIAQVLSNPDSRSKYDRRRRFGDWEASVSSGFADSARTRTRVS